MNTKTNTQHTNSPGLALYQYCAFSMDNFHVISGHDASGSRARISFPVSPRVAEGRAKKACTGKHQSAPLYL